MSTLVEFSFAFRLGIDFTVFPHLEGTSARVEGSLEYWRCTRADLEVVGHLESSSAFIEGLLERWRCTRVDLEEWSSFELV